MPREQLANFLDQTLFIDQELRFRLLLEVFIAVLDVAEPGTEDQVLDLNLLGGLLVAALDDGAGAAALVGIFELGAEIVEPVYVKTRRGVGYYVE